jgi:hypothetical protein
MGLARRLFACDRCSLQRGAQSNKGARKSSPDILCAFFSLNCLPVAVIEDLMKNAEQLWQRLFDTHYHNVYGYFLKRLGSPEDAADASQENRLGYPPIKTYRFTGEAFTAGVDTHEIDSAHPEMTHSPDIFVARKILSSKYQPYACGKIFRAPRSRPNFPISGWALDSVSIRIYSPEKTLADCFQQPFWGF